MGFPGFCGWWGEDDPVCSQEGAEEGRLAEILFYDSLKQQIFAERLQYVRFSSTGELVYGAHLKGGMGR